MSRGHAALGTAASTAWARSRVVRSGRRATMNCAIRRAHRSSPYSRRMRSISRMSDSLTMVAAVTGATIVNESDIREIERILREYGEERWARRIAQFIVARRPLRTTRDLAQAVEAAVPRAAWPRDINVATRTFQGIRIAVNDELGEIEAGLRAALTTLKPGGRMATISFHSLEDRLVKSFFNVESKDCICPPQQPVCTCGHRATLRTVTRRPVRPSDAEVAANPRARSSRLRVAEKL